MEKHLRGSLIRHIPVDGAYNIRDLGGYETVEGKTTVWGRFLRGAVLHNVSLDGQHTLIEYGLQTVIDLRHSKETEQLTNVFQGSDRIACWNIPMFNPEELHSMNGLVDLYYRLVDFCQAEIRQVFERLLRHDKGAVLFHCSAGKDRTGVIAALLLDMVGVPHQVIVEDYALTGQYADLIIEQSRRNRSNRAQDDGYEKFLECRPENILSLLNYISERYNGSAGYLRTIGLADHQIQYLKSRVTEP